MTIEQELRAASRAATPGPWERLGPTSGRRDEEGELHPFVLGPNGENPVCVMEGDWSSEQADATLIALSRNHIEALCDIAGLFREWHPMMHSMAHSLCPDDCAWAAALARLDAK